MFFFLEKRLIRYSYSIIFFVTLQHWLYFNSICLCPCNPKVCVIYGLILANHLETLTEFTHEELIVCKALENATDYDLKNFKEIMENYLKPTSNGRILLLSPPHAIGVYIIESLFLAQQSGVKWKKAFWI